MGRPARVDARRGPPVGRRPRARLAVFGLAPLIIHAVTAVAVCGLIVVSWLLTSGSATALGDVLHRPSDSLRLGFWPVWPIVAWGAALLIHAGVVVALLPGRLRRARRRAQRSATDVPATPALVHDAAPRRRWNVVMFVDVCDSTPLNERLGDDAWHGLLTRYREVVRTAVAARGGTEVGTAGDGFLVRFDSPSDAVLCAIDVQRALRESRRVDDEPLHTRVGLHGGEVVEAGGDVLGQVVNLASRVASAAGADEILVTEPVADQLVGSLELEDRGLQPLKGVSRQRHLLAVRWSEATTAEA